MPAQIHVNQGKARVAIPSRGGIAAIGGSQVPSAFGEDGREVQLQKSATHIQWRYEGDAAWTNLVALSELEGDPGAQGETGPMPYDYRGAWDGFTSYGLYDAVTYQGSLYWLPATGGWTIGGAPPAYNWELLVSKGDTGEQGETGKSAYQSYLDTTADDPVLTEEQWSEGGGGGGDYLPLAGGTMDANASIIWGNASAIREAGAQGLEIECSVGYRWQWVAGRMILRQINSGQIQRVLAIDGVTPGDTEDISEGFIVGTRWETQDGTIYECTDSTDSAAVWENVTPIPISTPGIAYVNSGGDDSTGAIGDPSKPYLTAQAAWDDGARNLELGGGSYTVTHYSTAPDGSSYETVRVIGLGKDSSSLTIDWTGTLATEESPAGKMPYAPRLISDHSVALTVNLSGSNAHSGDNNGGASPQFDLQNCHIAAFSSNGGNGSGSGTTGSVSGGYTKWCETPFFSGLVVEHYASLVNNIWIGPVNFSSIPLSGLVSASAKGKIIGRKTAGAGNYEECDLSDFTHVNEHYMRTTDFTDSSGTVSNVTGLSCSVAVNEKVLIEIVGFRAGGAAGSGLKISFSGPSSPTDVKYTIEHWNAVNTGRTVVAATSFNTILTQADGSMDYLPIRVTLTLINGANADTVQFRAASETSGTTITLLKGMTMRVHRIP